MSTITFQDHTVETDHAIITPTAPTHPRAYRAHLYDQSGTLTKLNGTIYFVADEDGAITKFEVEMVNFCTVLGEVLTKEAQAMWNRINGGAWNMACDRPIGRS